MVVFHYSLKITVNDVKSYNFGVPILLNIFDASTIRKP